MRAVGALILSQNTQRVLMQLRSPGESHSMSWGLWGGRLNVNEGDLNGLKRELCEELGYPGVPDTVGMSHVYTFTSRDYRFRHVSYLILCKDEFTPTIDNESSGYCWVDLWHWPQPLHKYTAKMFSSRGFKNALEGLLRNVKAN